MPFSRARAARLLIQMQHYHDELLEDFGADPLRKTGVFAPLKEVFAPYEPKDYRSVVPLRSATTASVRPDPGETAARRTAPVETDGLS